MKTEKILLSQFTREDIKEMLSEVMKEEIVNLPLKKSEKELDLITRRETSKILGISLTTLHDFTLRGIVPAYRIGTRIRYKKDEVIASLKSVNDNKFKRG